jgi:hypothetical protein
MNNNMAKGILIYLTVNTMIATAQQKTPQEMVWQGIFSQTTEYCRITADNENISYAGVVVGASQGKPVDISYALETDSAFNLLTVSIQALDQPWLILRRTGKHWQDGKGKLLPEFDACTDIDISLTPLTNTFPIRKMHMAVGASKTVEVIYIDALTGGLKPVAQKYSRLSANVYGYENLASGFTADLTVDNEGFVIDYPGAWRQIIPDNFEKHSLAPVKVNDEFSRALLSDKPSAELGDDAGLYARLIGNWEVAVLDYNVEGRKFASTGRWYFSWVLEGRTIQDVFIVPDQRRPGLPIARNRYGTTLRQYDQASKQWKLYWFNPVSGVTNTLTARKADGQIIQEGKEVDGTLIRWTFLDIRPNSFHWRGEESKDGGHSYQLKAEFFARRR